MQGVLVGYGIIGRGHLKAYDKTASKIAAIVDSAPGSQQRSREDHPHIPVYASLPEALRGQRFDFADICTPPASHLELMTEALAHQLHVMCEKPFLLDVDGYPILMKAAEAAGRCVVAAHNYRFSPAAQILLESVSDGTVGDVVKGHFRTVRKGHAVGVPEYAPDWRRDLPVSGGGILTDHGPHSVYLAAAIMGRFPTAVSCLSGRLTQDRWHDTEDTAWMTLDFDGVRWDIDLTWAGASRSTRYSLVGLRGAITVDGDDVTVAHDGRIKQMTVPSDFDDPAHSSWFAKVIANFEATVAAGVSPAETLQEPLLTTNVLQAARKSADSGGVWQPVAADLMSTVAS